VVAQSNEQAHGGSFSAKVVHNADVGAHYTIQNVLNMTKAYEVDVWVYLPSGQTTSTISVAVGGAPAGTPGSSTTTTDSWVNLTTTLENPSNQGIGLLSGSSDTENEFWYIDDFSVKEVLTGGGPRSRYSGGSARSRYSGGGR
jgi:hypothetical protein